MIQDVEKDWILVRFFSDYFLIACFISFGVWVLIIIQYTPMLFVTEAVVLSRI